MRLWHQDLIPFLDRQHLLGQHREVCALRGKGWGRKHATVDYVFKYDRSYLYAYHSLVMREMLRRGYNVSPEWLNPAYRGTSLGYEEETEDRKMEVKFNIEYCLHKSRIYPEHDKKYFDFCVKLLKERNGLLPEFKEAE